MFFFVVETLDGVELEIRVKRIKHNCSNRQHVYAPFFRYNLLEMNKEKIDRLLLQDKKVKLTMCLYFEINNLALYFNQEHCSCDVFSLFVKSN